MKRVQLEPWNTFDKLCLASAVHRSGDQNWTAISRTAKHIFEENSKFIGDEKRHAEWFSIKQCAAHYEFLLKNVVGPRRKKRSEKGPELSNESPTDVIYQVIRQEFMEELKRTLDEIRQAYLKTKREKEDIENGILDEKLDDMRAEIEAKEREKDIKLKLKCKIGEKNIENESLKQTEVDIHSTKEVPAIETKPSATTSPLLTSLLQSPSPLVRTPMSSSVTPTISLLLNSAPSIPTNDSPTLSKLLETPSPLILPPELSPVNIQSTSVPSISTPILKVPPKLEAPIKMELPSDLDCDMASPPSLEIGLPSHPSQLEGETAPMFPPPLEMEIKQEPKEEPATEGVVEEIETTVIETTDVIIDTPEKDIKNEDRRKGNPRQLVLEMENMETENEVVVSVEEVIENVEESNEAVGTTTETQPCGTIFNQTTESEILDEHIQSLELDQETVELIVMGSNQRDQTIAGNITKDTEDSSSLSESQGMVKDDSGDEEVISPESNSRKECMEELSNNVVFERNSEEENEVETNEEVTLDSEIKLQSVDVTYVADILDMDSPDDKSDTGAEYQKEVDDVKVEKENAPVILEEEVAQDVPSTEGGKEKGDRKSESSPLPSTTSEDNSQASASNSVPGCSDSNNSLKVEKFMKLKDPLKEILKDDIKSVSSLSPEEVSSPADSKPESDNTDLVKDSINLPTPSPAVSQTDCERDQEGENRKRGRRKISHSLQSDSKPSSPASSILTDEDKDYRAWKKSILLVYSRLAAHKYASVFLKPITEAEATGYHKIVLKPMDLTTIKRNIETGVIKTTVEFQRDMLLMVQNAIMYNKSNTLVYKMAHDMLNDMIAQMGVMVQALGDGVPLSRESLEGQTTRGRVSKSVAEENVSKRKRHSIQEDTRSIKKKKTDTN